MNKYVLMFIACAALSWGVYVPIVHEAASKLGSNLRAFLFVGLAYFLVAVVVPCIFIFVLKNDPTAGPSPNFKGSAMAWGIAAGISGAVGALCVIFAVTIAKDGGSPLYVAPLVFAGAPIINTLATIYYFHPTDNKPDWKFFAGLVMAALGAVIVMINKPKPTKKPSAPAAAVSTENPGEAAPDAH